MLHSLLDVTYNVSPQQSPMFITLKASFSSFQQASPLHPAPPDSLSPLKERGHYLVEQVFNLYRIKKGCLQENKRAGLVLHPDHMSESWVPWQACPPATLAALCSTKPHLNLERVVSAPGASRNFYVNKHNPRSSSPRLNVKHLLEVHVWSSGRQAVWGKSWNLWDIEPYLGNTGPGFCLTPLQT